MANKCSLPHIHENAVQIYQCFNEFLVTDTSACVHVYVCMQAHTCGVDVQVKCGWLTRRNLRGRQSKNKSVSSWDSTAIRADHSSTRNVATRGCCCAVHCSTHSQSAYPSTVQAQRRKVQAANATITPQPDQPHTTTIVLRHRQQCVGRLWRAKGCH